MIRFCNYVPVYSKWFFGASLEFHSLVHLACYAARISQNPLMCFYPLIKTANWQRPASNSWISSIKTFHFPFCGGNPCPLVSEITSNNNEFQMTMIALRDTSLDMFSLRKISSFTSLGGNIKFQTLFFYHTCKISGSRYVTKPSAHAIQRA